MIFSTFHYKNSHFFGLQGIRGQNKFKTPLKKANDFITSSKKAALLAAERPFNHVADNHNMVINL
ncbi:hypothetical protein BIT28_10600 [Photobacterium proteolyticum]|uniref:Uncharacterized protein n=1 Tax=Photobacterium proteolyticum TaxID=1903952 RepID=A0A1Q9G6R8_9GAMM|nr:hypothetical protein BIT28_10600 [Photobacterium proteolyticum]